MVVRHFMPVEGRAPIFKNIKLLWGGKPARTSMWARFSNSWSVQTESMRCTLASPWNKFPGDAILPLAWDAPSCDALAAHPRGPGVRDSGKLGPNIFCLRNPILSSPSRSRTDMSHRMAEVSGVFETLARRIPTIAADRTGFGALPQRPFVSIRPSTRARERHTPDILASPVSLSRSPSFRA